MVEEGSVDVESTRLTIMRRKRIGTSEENQGERNESRTVQEFTKESFKVERADEARSVG